MQWFRRHRLLGAQAALIALGVQFAVAFSHVHAFDRGSAPLGFAAAVVASDDTSSPPDHGSKLPGDFCDICANIQLIASAKIAVAPALPIPATFDARGPSLTSDVGRADLAYFEHRSRGPPQA